jgi:hypothetical protein
MPDDAAWRRQLSQDSKQTAVKKKNEGHGAAAA